MSRRQRFPFLTVESGRNSNISTRIFFCDLSCQAVPHPFISLSSSTPPLLFHSPSSSIHHPPSFLPLLLDSSSITHPSPSHLLHLSFFSYLPLFNFLPSHSFLFSFPFSYLFCSVFTFLFVLFFYFPLLPFRPSLPFFFFFFPSSLTNSIHINLSSPFSS